MTEIENITILGILEVFVLIAIFLLVTMFTWCAIDVRNDVHAMRAQQALLMVVENEQRDALQCMAFPNDPACL